MTYQELIQRIKAEAKYIPLPDNYPPPKFHFGQTVYYLGDSRPFLIVGMKCYHRWHGSSFVPHSWYYSLYYAPWGYQDDWEEERKLTLEPQVEEEDTSE